MTDNKIAEIRARHERDNRYGDGLYPGAHKDRAWLLAEVEKLTRERDEARAEVEKLRAALRDIERGDYSDPMCERTPEQRAREALGVKP